MKDFYSKNKLIIGIISLCLILRFAFFIAVKPWTGEAERRLLEKDALEYNTLAVNILNYHQFSYLENGPPNSFRTPGYPVYIAAVYFIFGQVPWVVLLSQIFIDTFSCLLLYLLFKRILNTGIALTASLFYALDPFLILHTSTLLSDILFVFLIICGVYFFSFVFSDTGLKKNIWFLILPGIFLGLATLVRTISEFLPILLIAFLIYVYRKKIGLSVKYSVILITAFVITISPWLLRNYFVFDNISLSSAGSETLIVMYLPPMEMERRGQDYDSVTTSLLRESDSLMLKDGLNPDKMNDFQKSGYWKQTALKYIFRYPLPFAKHYVIGFIHYFGNLGTLEYSKMLRLNPGKKEEFDIKAHPNFADLVKKWFQQKSMIEILLGFFIGLFLLISYICVLAGLVVTWKNLNKPFLILCILIIAYFVVLTGPQGMERYKLPSIPFYLAFAGIGLDYIISKRKTRMGGSTKD